MIGQKGIPATYGGVEHHVEELGARLAEFGHDVVVYTRPNYAERSLREYRGMRLVSLPTIDNKYLDATVHSFIAAWATWFGGFDVVHFHAIGPSLMSPIARLRGRGVVSTIHGQDWRRAKWGPLATMSLRLGEWMALHVPHATISVSSSLTTRYRNQGHSRVTYIPNGVTIGDGDDPDYLRGLGLEPRGYIFWAGRLVPEKAVQTLIDAYMALGTKVPLVIAGGTSHSDDYAAELQRNADPDRVRFIGYVYGDDLSTLFRNAALFVLPSIVEGQPIVLLEALAYGVPVIASDIAANLEVLDDGALTFPVGDAGSLTETLGWALAHLDELLTAAAETSAICLDEHDWDSVTRRTAALYARVAKRGATVEDAPSPVGGETALSPGRR